MQKFRKKPVTIEAVRFTGVNFSEVEAFVGGRCRSTHSGNPLIETLEGSMMASPGDWIIKGVKGEFYPCKPDIFAATYEPVTNEA